MGSKSIAEPAVGAVSHKKKHSKVSPDSAVLDNDHAFTKKKKKHSKNKDPSAPDFVSDVVKKKREEALIAVKEEPPKKKKKSKSVIGEGDQIVVAKSPRKHLRLEEASSEVGSVPKSPKKRRAEKELEVPLLPKKKHKELVEDAAGKESDSQSENIPSKGKKISNTVEFWPHDDLMTLFSRLKATLPNDDKLCFLTRQERIDWNAIAFGDFSGEDCKMMWLQVTRSLRRFRLLSEVLADAEVWAGKPWTKFGKKEPKYRKHPDEPHRPLSAYMHYYMTEKPSVHAKNPELSMGEVTKLIAARFKSLSPEERKKYDDMAAESKKDYLESMKIFEKNHPECVTKLPKKSPTPLQLFTEDRSKKLQNSGLSPQQIKEHIKEKWKNLSDKKRIKWIKKAAQEHKGYQEALKEYMACRPDFHPSQKKTAVLSRKELELLLKDAGRPEKPPTTAQKLFAKEEYKSELEKGTPPEEIFGILATRWREMPPSEKISYTERFSRMIEQYKKDYDAYMDSLSDEQREYEELVSHTVKASKKKKKEGNDKEEEVEVVAKKTQKPPFPGEPEKPPSSAYQLFLRTFCKDSKFKATDAKTYWDYLPDSDKAKFVAKQKDLMEKYMVKFERFLKSLSKEQLAAYKRLYKDKSTKEGENFGSNYVEKSSKAEKDGSSSDSEPDSSDSENDDSDPSSQSEEADNDSSSDSEEEHVNNNVVITKPAVSSNDSEESDSDSD